MELKDKYYLDANDLCQAAFEFICKKHKLPKECAADVRLKVDFNNNEICAIVTTTKKEINYV